MSAIHLLRVGEVAEPLLDGLGSELEAEFQVPCEVLPGRLDPGWARHRERGQFHSTPILARLGEHVLPTTWRLLGVTEHDLYIPILTFVFGEAQVEGRSALVSTHRLRQEFYGLPANVTLTLERLAKEAVHEIGHTLGLTHCEDYRCAMSPSHGVERIDLKEPMLCVECVAHAEKPPGRR